MAYIGNQPTIGQYRKLDDISGSFNGSLTAFTMQVGSTNVSAGSVFQLLISLGGVIQNPGTDFTVSGSTITFTTAPAASLSFFGILMGQPLNTATPGDSTVTGAKIVDGTITGGKLAASLNVSQNESQIALFQRPSGATNFTVKSSATTTLKIDGTDGVLAFVNAGGATPAYTIGRDNTDNTLRISQNSSAPGTNDLLTITSAGRVGIGTTSPARDLSIGDGSDDVIVNLMSGTAQFCLIDFGDTAGNAQGRIGYFNDQDCMTFRTGGSGEDVRIDSAGRLLVGTSSDTNAQFVVTSGAQVTGAAADGNTNRATLDYSAPLARLMSHNGASGGSIAFFVNVASFGVAERGRFTTQGFFKASSDGTYNSVTAQNHEFCQHVGGDTNTVFECSHNNNPFGILIRYPNVSPNGSGNEFLRCLDSTATRLVVTSNGGIQNFSANNVNLSDEREKKNIEALDSTWDCLKHWELKKFHYNEDKDTDDKKYGVIAQQVAPHCPEIVSDWIKQKAEDAVLDEDGNIVTPASEEVTRLAVKEQQMMWMAIKALQEAQTRIETLEAEVAALKGS